MAKTKTGISADPELIELVDQLARQNQHSRSFMICILLEEALAAREDAPEQKEKVPVVTTGT